MFHIHIYSFPVDIGRRGLKFRAAENITVIWHGRLSGSFCRPLESLLGLNRPAPKERSKLWFSW